jgi:tetratricopeptide (TPR) repeat protein
MIWGGLAWRAPDAVERIEHPAERSTASGLVALAQGRPREAIADLRRALAHDPAEPAARAQLLDLRFAGIPEAAAEVEAMGPGRPAEAIVRRAVAAAEAHAWTDVAALDQDLGAIEMADPLFPLALRLRVLWRNESDEPARGREALELLPGLAGNGLRRRDFLEWGRAAAVAREPGQMLSGLARALSGGTRAAAPHARIRREVYALLRKAEVPPTYEPWLRWLDQASAPPAGGRP